MIGRMKCRALAAALNKLESPRCLKAWEQRLEVEVLAEGDPRPCYYLGFNKLLAELLVLGARAADTEVKVDLQYFRDAVGQFGDAPAHEVLVSLGSTSCPIYFCRGDEVAIVMPVRA